MHWEFHHPRMTDEHLGLIPMWLSEANPKGLVDQMDDGYRFGGFKQYPIKGFMRHGNQPCDFDRSLDFCLKYPGDPLMRPLASIKLRDELLCFYDHAICAVFQRDGSFVAARFD